MEIAADETVKDLWRIGWFIAPQTIDDVYEMLDRAARFCDEGWMEAVRRGDAPPEDVSPAEGFLGVKEIIKDAIRAAHEGKCDCGHV